LMFAKASCDRILLHPEALSVLNDTKESWRI
jgi:hypothetical protein